MNTQTSPTQSNSEDPALNEEVRKRIVLEEQLKQVSKPLKVARIAWWATAASAISVVVVGILLWIDGSLQEKWAVVLILPAAIGAYLVLVLALVGFLRWFIRSRLERELRTRITTQKSEELQERLDEDFFTNLVKINFKYIDQYYLQTQLQADKSFLLCAAAACVSLLVILAGIVMLFLNQTGKEAGYVATAAGTLGEFIAAVFFYLYNRTITKMGEYHQKLVLTQNVSLALKISEELPPAEQVIARTKLIDYLSKDINLFLSMRSSNDVAHLKKD